VVQKRAQPFAHSTEISRFVKCGVFFLLYEEILFDHSGDLVDFPLVTSFTVNF
jgi:hypothetical protein